MFQEWNREQRLLFRLRELIAISADRRAIGAALSSPLSEHNFQSQELARIRVRNHHKLKRVNCRIFCRRQNRHAAVSVGRTAAQDGCIPECSHLSCHRPYFELRLCSGRVLSLAVLQHSFKIEIAKRLLCEGGESKARQRQAWRSGPAGDGSRECWEQEQKVMFASN